MLNLESLPIVPRSLIFSSDWQVPSAQVYTFGPKASRYCVLVPVINEDGRLLSQLRRMADLEAGADVIIADGGSTDGSCDPETLQRLGVRALLVKTGPGQLSAQLRMGFAFAIQEGYDGIVTVDGNGKDGVEAIPLFIRALEEGRGFVQGSRYIPGGEAIRTPLIRHFAVRFIHAPLIGLAAGFRYTDTTNGFRAFSREFLLDPGVQPFREVFEKYSISYYLAIRASRLNYPLREIPVRREYPASGQIPTKIRGLAGILGIMRELIMCVFGRYDPD